MSVIPYCVCKNYIFNWCSCKSCPVKSVYTFNTYQASCSISAIVPHPVWNAVYFAKGSHHQGDSTRDLEAADKMCSSYFSFLFLLFSLGGHFNPNMLLRLISELSLLLPSPKLHWLGENWWFSLEVKAGAPDLGVVLSSWVCAPGWEKHIQRLEHQKLLIPCFSSVIKYLANRTASFPPSCYMLIVKTLVKM